jgi:hypothetical protein
MLLQMYTHSEMFFFSLNPPLLKIERMIEPLCIYPSVLSGMYLNPLHNDSPPGQGEFRTLEPEIQSHITG